MPHEDILIVQQHCESGALSVPAMLMAACDQLRKLTKERLKADVHAAVCCCALQMPKP